MSCPKSNRARKTERQKIRRAERRRRKAAGFKSPSEKRMTEIRAGIKKRREKAEAETAQRNKAAEHIVLKRNYSFPNSPGSRAIQAERQKLMEKGLLIK